MEKVYPLISIYLFSLCQAHALEYVARFFLMNMVPLFTYHKFNLTVSHEPYYARVQIVGTWVLAAYYV